MGIVKLRKNFHQSKWDEPIIFELSTENERGIHVPPVERDIEESSGNLETLIPESIRRKQPPSLPEVAQLRVLRHYIRLSQEVLGVDVNIDIGQGTCTMKYSPKINEVLVRSRKVTEIHPLQPEDTVQGALEIIYNLDHILRELSGFSRFVFQPGGGSQALYTMASIVYRYHQVKGNTHKDEIITTLLSHPSDAATAKVKGFKVIDIPPDPETGLPDMDAFREAISERTAGMIICNPEDTEIFNPHIKEMTSIIHEVGGICAYDQANANGLLGIVRSIDLGFDLGFYNLHKTFSSPHGCGGPGLGAVGVIKELESFLPIPVVDYDESGKKYYLNFDLPNTIGKVREFYGSFPVILRAYAWVRVLGEEGLREVAKVSIINNNYVMKKILNEVKGASISFPKTEYRVSQVRYSFKKLADETGVTVEDVIRRITDFGFHLWTSHHPWIVPEPFTIEPTESYSKDDLDEYVEGLKTITQEAYENPERVKNAPFNSVIHKIQDMSFFEDPEKWAPTWRVYLRKHRNQEVRK
ncbi:MAG: aminomethyl-transferring glycine dehydrogenase subunit GcvPB [Thermoplasmata archaeon]